MAARTAYFKPHTLLRYLYRDASSYKAHGAVVLPGVATPEHDRRLRAGLIDGEYFIPEKVGLPSLRERLYEYASGSPTDDDHLLHEFVELRAATAEEVDAGSSAGQLDEVLERFEREARSGWWAGSDALIERLGLDP